MLKTKIYSILESPSLNGWGFLIGIIGLLFAIYTYIDSQQISNLVAKVQPLRTNIVSNANVENIDLMVNGKKLSGPLTAVQIVIWNDGNKPIKYEDILEPLIIKPLTNNTIVVSKLIKQTRKVNNLTITNYKNSINIKFKILEKNDGLVIQLIYEGNDKVKFEGSGVIVGQRNFIVEDYSLNDEDFFGISTPSKKSESNIWGSSLLLVGIFSQLLIALNWIRISINRLITNWKLNHQVSLEFYKNLFEVIIYLGMIVFILYITYPIYLEIRHVPPASLIDS